MNNREISHYIILPVFIILAVILRFFTFFPTVIDGDETTYLIIARQWLQGLWPYVDNVEIKPLGIFALFAAFMKLFGDAVWSIRLFAAVTVGLTAYFLYRAKKRTSQNDFVSIGVGVIYMLMVSAHKYTWSANTEIFFNMFTVAGLWTLLQARKLHFFLLTGLLMGLGFIVKYMVLMDFLAFGLLYLFVLGENDKWGKRLINAIITCIGFALPFLFALGIYFSRGQLDAFWFASFTLPSNYSGNGISWHAIVFIAEFLGQNLPVTALFVFSLIRVCRNKGNNLSRVFIPLWFVFSLIAVLSTAKNFHHYLIQLMLPLAFFSLDGFVDLKNERPFLKRKAVLIPLLVLAFIAVPIFQAFKLLKHDINKEVATFLNERMAEKDVLYVDFSNGIYFLTEKNPPSRYIHQTLLSNPEHIKAFEIDVEREFESIVAQTPDYLALKTAGHPKIQEYINTNCELIGEFSEGVRVFRKK